MSLTLDLQRLARLIVVEHGRDISELAVSKWLAEDPAASRLPEPEFTALVAAVVAALPEGTSE